MKHNVGGHVKASEVIEEYCRKNNIQKTPHPPNSLDLNMIEGLWDYKKDKAEEFPVFGGT